MSKKHFPLKINFGPIAVNWTLPESQHSTLRCLFFNLKLTRNLAWHSNKRTFAITFWDFSGP